ncbi:MAG TPA: mannonate dehydratase [Candidatus Eisenbergiella merdipullorum]|uniref:mannonate dehydratase n=1 Tax=Candidatus Eisenbergiella merdipullorum TaxID=2838553 RepID=A0A9D2I9A9_9FIRM|nr:mannonate dehydratase [Candidatus Eisenbergiella merdipullorum]
MLLTDYFRAEHDITWDFAKQCGVKHGVIRLPEGPGFDLCSREHWNEVYRRFTDFGIKPVVVEPMPNRLHDHIKAGDEKRDESIDQVIRMFPIMEELGIHTVCFNFMAYIGWCRTKNDIRERGNAFVTGFDLKDYVPGCEEITESQLWENYEYFIKAVIPEAEKHQIKLALHPDDPPVPALGRVSRIMTSFDDIHKAIHLVESDSLGVTMCQACYYIMGENLYEVIPKLKEKIFFIHFRNVTGSRERFRETFHDNGDIRMGEILRLYLENRIDVPIRVDHVPTMAGESDKTGYAPLGRLYALGYLKGLLEACR